MTNWTELHDVDRANGIEAAHRYLEDDPLRSVLHWRRSRRNAWIALVVIVGLATANIYLSWCLISLYLDG